MIGMAIAGTAGYAPPEQLGSHDFAVGPRSDVFACGKLLGFLLYGTLNWKPRHREHISQGLNKLVDQCTDDDPEFRPKDLGKVLACLHKQDAVLHNQKVSEPVRKPSNTSVALSDSRYVDFGRDIKMELVYVQAGRFQMGSNDGDSDEQPVHEVRISQDYWLGKYEVTQEQWTALMGSNPSDFKGAKRPVECVSWNDAQAYCVKLTDRERRAGCLPSGYVYCLPTEAEWEYAARGGAKSRGFEYSGSDAVGDVAWYDDNSGEQTHDVGGKRGNELGLYDMSGNVWEWCQDWYDSDYYGETQGATDPVNTAKASFRVVRGGSWLSHAGHCRAAGRSRFRPDITDYYLGFRVCLARR